MSNDIEEVTVSEEEEEKEKVEIVEKPIPKIKPEIDSEICKKLDLRKMMKRKKPEFLRQEWFRYTRLGEKWRKPKGIHSKLARHMKYRINVPSIGYGSPRVVRYLHPSGFKEVMVYNPNDLNKIDKKTECARIAHTVGKKKRIEIQNKADELGIRILNRVKV